MNEILPLSIGLSLVVSLVFSELFGILGTGLVVPGYLALSFHHPKDIALTFLIAFLSYLCVEILSNFLLIFGKRKVVFILLFGYFFGYLLNYQVLPDLDITYLSEVRGIGFIIPGLIAIWYERQGVLETTSVLILASIFVKILLIFLLGTELETL
ncbi:poly-gamma-glutamate biosynthesis protein PgsC [Leptospira congkakensis]|uniref:Poly-gamma-glutamate biosynthesis protein PgsC n=1 Tax=Leptospira congkakensis TaxID=2484932 RepID=A0A4Z1AFP8_9LEPT|nr:poly-gamma-glutamate biosynthesis protein PgsC [Leptospira congkakensis]TGL85104.1 poly-gamma-glutamate biosynthesis protein PgsC [Leptospira congkakensis]TGL92816.1 poly-gamma-glutamate biosynthesis protein PgsC [Leptospira congkakensis]TGL95553.1 poly-gamma-glutamate biosynthesis protein PgsC [Leptospira congkakensis]